MKIVLLERIKCYFRGTKKRSEFCNFLKYLLICNCFFSISGECSSVCYPSRKEPYKPKCSDTYERHLLPNRFWQRVFARTRNCSMLMHGSRETIEKSFLRYAILGRFYKVFFKIQHVDVTIILFQTFCVCVKRITLCNCLCSSSPFSRDFASVARNIGKVGAKSYFRDHGTTNTKHGFSDFFPVLKI